MQLCTQLAACVSWSQQTPGMYHSVHIPRARPRAPRAFSAQHPCTPAQPPCTPVHFIADPVQIQLMSRAISAYFRAPDVHFRMTTCISRALPCWTCENRAHRGTSLGRNNRAHVGGTLRCIWCTVGGHMCNKKCVVGEVTGGEVGSTDDQTESPRCTNEYRTLSIFHVVLPGGQHFPS